MIMNKLNFLAALVGLGNLSILVSACGDSADCYGPSGGVGHVRQIKRMQPGAPGAAYGPKGPLEWGQVNFLHTVS